jgi:hypothetical protein
LSVCLSLPVSVCPCLSLSVSVWPELGEVRWAGGKRGRRREGDEWGREGGRKPKKAKWKRRPKPQRGMGRQERDKVE